MPQLSAGRGVERYRDADNASTTRLEMGGPENCGLCNRRTGYVWDITRAARFERECPADRPLETHWYGYVAVGANDPLEFHDHRGVKFAVAIDTLLGVLRQTVTAVGVTGRLRPVRVKLYETTS